MNECTWKKVWDVCVYDHFNKIPYINQHDIITNTQVQEATKKYWIFFYFKCYAVE